MKVVVLSTSTNETTKYSDHLRTLGHEMVRLEYDAIGHSETLMYAKLKEHAPNFIVYIGQRWGEQPSMSMLANINHKIAPMVHICSDAADPPWWDLLTAYHYAGAFALQVAIDGSRKWPLYDSQMTTLTPVDPKDFDSPGHAVRSVACGYAGNAGSGPGSQRTALLAALLEKRAIDLKIRSNLPHTYEAYCDYLSRCRMSINPAWSGTENAMQVKGRVLESGLAGCLLLETAGAPTRDWFTPGVDYLEFKTPDEAIDLIRSMQHEPGVTEEFGQRLRTKILAEHTPAKFWSRILKRIGLSDDTELQRTGS